jgi:hypothetical protein
MAAEHEPPDDPADTGSAVPAGDDVGEARWPMAGAVVAAIVLTILLPEAVRAGSEVAAPARRRGVAHRRHRRRPWQDQPPHPSAPGDLYRARRRPVLGTLWATGQLIDDLIHGGPETNSASALLEAGSVVWASNNIAFALLYWELDGGGAAARAHHVADHLDLAFPQQLNPRLASANWQPRFIDYLYLGFTNATAFSPTDVMPLVPWAKITMGVQAVVSLAILGLVVARAVNVFT